MQARGPDRRRMMVLTAAAACLAAAWSGAVGSETIARQWRPYALAAPLYIEGPVTTIGWVDPQPHLELLHRPGYALPAGSAAAGVSGWAQAA